MILARRLRVLLGLLLAGQGLLVLSGVLDHETPPLVAAVLLVAGALLLATAGSASGPAGPPGGRRLAAAAVGAVAAAGVLAYNAAAGWTFAPPEIAILAYGLALVAASPFLDRSLGNIRVGTLVAWSFPLLAAPLGLWALNATLEAQASWTPLAAYMHYGLVLPASALLQLGGLDAALHGDTVALVTPRGVLYVTIGVVCAGLYAGILFLGVFGLFAWESRIRGPRLLAYLALGLAGLHVANVLRLALLAWVGWAHGGAALDAFHRHAGWALFLLWTVAFWALVLRRFERPAPPTT